MPIVLKSLALVGLLALMLGFGGCSSSTPPVSQPVITSGPVTSPGTPEDPQKPK